MPRYPTPYPAMIRPGFPPRSIHPVNVAQALQRPPIIPGIRGVPPMVRPAVPLFPPSEKAQTTVYVGKIAQSVDNDFLLSLLQLCGPVKNWKRAQDPSNGAPKGFGFCEFESAEGILRAMRLLSKLSIDGQELVLNINQATREYLEKYVQKKTETERAKETEKGADKESETDTNVEKVQIKTELEETEKNSVDSGDGEHQENTKKFGIVTDEDREADKDGLEKIKSMIEERIKTRPLPPPPLQAPADGSAKSESELPFKQNDKSPDVDDVRSGAGEDTNDDDNRSHKKAATENEKPEMSSPDKSRKAETSKERERDRDVKREKERELERYERERERERVRRERDREQKLRESERLYKERLKKWEAREKGREYQHRDEKRLEKEREQERRREILKQEDESDDDDSRKRKRRSSNNHEERKRKRMWEKEDDSIDRLKEGEEIAEAKRRAEEEQLRKEEIKSFAQADEETAMQVDMEEAKPVFQQDRNSPNGKTTIVDQDNGGNVFANGDTVGSGPTSDFKQSNAAPTRKLGFGLVGSGKRTSVPSLFIEGDDEGEDEKKMRPLVPIDYSTEELQAVQTNPSVEPANTVAAAELARHSSVANTKDDKPATERERNRRFNDRSSQRDRDRNDDDGPRINDGRKEKSHGRYDKEKGKQDKPKSENKKILDAKQLIDMIPKTKEELFAYEINWAIYDEHALHERMKPWISRKIAEFLGEEEATLVEYIMSCTKDHVQASKMLELLSAILDDEAEMFVLKMWRMLIFEIKKVETGLSGKTKA